MLFLAGCQSAGQPTPSQGSPANPETVMALGQHEGWQELTLIPGKRKTLYRAATLDGEPVLHAAADSSASGLQVPVDLDPHQRRYLNFSWRADSLPEDADVSVREAEDSAVRIIVAFDGDVSKLDNRERSFFEQVKFFTGRDMPYATLMYVWSNNHKLEDVAVNPHTKRVRKIVLSNKGSSLKTWHRFKRDLVADFTKAYGYKPPGKIKYIGLMTDADNTASQSSAIYGRIKLSEN